MTISETYRRRHPGSARLYEEAVNTSEAHIDHTLETFQATIADMQAEGML